MSSFKYITTVILISQGMWLTLTYARSNSKLNMAQERTKLFDWRRDACPTGDTIEGKDAAVFLAEEILRAELAGWRAQTPQCLNPEDFRFFRAGPFDSTDTSETTKIFIKNPKDVKVMPPFRRLFSPALGEAFEVRYEAKDEHGIKYNGSFIFSRIKGSTPHKSEVGCVSILQPPTHIMNLRECSKRR